MAERYQCELPRDVLAKAVEELNEPEDNAERLRAIDELKQLFLEANPSLDLIREDDQFILRFLRARKFNLERALKMLTNYHVQTTSWSKVFDKVKNPQSISHILDAGIVVPLKGKARDGSSVVVWSPGFGKKHNLIDVAAAIFLTMEKLIENEEMQVHGVTVVLELKFFSMNYVVQTTASVARRFVGITQNTLPVRVKSVNAVNEPKIFDIVAAIARPFVEAKIRSRYRLHGSEFSSLHEIIPKSVLPPKFDGNGPELDILNWKNTLLEEHPNV